MALLSDVGVRGGGRGEGRDKLMRPTGPGQSKSPMPHSANYTVNTAATVRLEGPGHAVSGANNSRDGFRTSTCTGIGAKAYKRKDTERTAML